LAKHQPCTNVFIVFRYDAARSRLREMRDAQVEELIPIREAVKEKQQQWQHALNDLIRDKNSGVESILSAITEQEAALEEKNTEHEDLVRRHEAEAQTDREKRATMEEEKKQEEEKFRASLQEKENDVNELSHQHESLVQETVERKRL
jgi:putative protein kinase ArgK-like GTPase of G3E family